MVKYNENVFPDADAAILLATYNGEKFLSEQCDSLLRQSLGNFICFIHDDGSKDGTINIIKQYCNNYPETFIFMGSDRLGGAKANFMYMLGKVQADYIMFCDQDDFWLNNKVEKSLSTMKQLEAQYGNNLAFCAYSDVRVVDTNLNTIADSFYAYVDKNPYAVDLISLLKYNVCVGCTMIINDTLRNFALRYGNINSIVMHDWWCSLVCSLTGVLYYIDEPLSLYRQHTGNVVGARHKVKFYEKLNNFQERLGQKKESALRSRKYAKELINIIPSDNKNYKFLHQLTEIEKKNKIQRISFYYKNKLFHEKNFWLLEMLFV